MLARMSILIIAVSFFIGCAGETKKSHMGENVPVAQADKGQKEQASSLAQTFVDNHNKVMQEIAEIKKIGTKSLENEEAITKAAQKSLKTIEQLSRSQGTGEITIFFPLESSKINEKSLEHDRLIRFVDFLSRESKGRKILFVSIGSASAIGSKKINLQLAKERSEAPVDIIDKYLVNTPHGFFKVYGTGDLYSPKDVEKRKHVNYQHVRLIAFYETDQIPSLPEEPVKK